MVEGGVGVTTPVLIPVPPAPPGPQPGSFYPSKPDLARLELEAKGMEWMI